MLDQPTDEIDPRDKVLTLVANSLPKIRSCLFTQEFENLTSLLISHRSCITGVGKASLAAHKLAATLASNGTPSIFAHSTELLHGDLGSVQVDDILIAYSNSGKTDQILELSKKAKEIGIAFVLITGNKEGEIVENAALVIDYGKIEEACSLNLTPTTSTIVQMIIADAIAMYVQAKRGLSYHDYSKFHGCGYLGYISRLKAQLDKGNSKEISGS
jgi:arabinose-5-phosphate isomerase